MKLLIVCSKNSGRVAPFILEQADSLSKLGVNIDFFCIEGKGIGGYLSNLKLLKAKIQQYKPDLIHAHYGLSGLLANMQRTIPVVSTYHGSDINNAKVFLLSRLNMALSGYNIFVSETHLAKSKLKRACSVIPCGIDTKLFSPQNKMEARLSLGLDNDKKIILFAGAYANPVKNSGLAKAAKKLVLGCDMIELDGYTRNEVSLLLSAVDVLLMTSFSEGSPQIVKEAMACNCPVVSVEVGDVKQIIGETEGCYVTDVDPMNVAVALQKVFDFNQRTCGRERILGMGLDIDRVANKLVGLYNNLK